MGNLAPLGFEELDGFQFPSRAQGIAAWHRRKDEQEFRALCTRLRKLKWAREKWEKAQGALREKLREKSRRAAKRAKARKRMARVYRCTVCGAEWCRTGLDNKGPRTVCSPTCQLAAKRKKDREYQRRRREKMRNA